MFSTFLEKLSGFFDKHWLLRYFFPSLVFWAAGLVVYAAAHGITQPLELWRRQPNEVQVILLAGALLWVTLFAYLLANFATALIRLFEGYWQHPPLSWLRRPRQTYFEMRFRYLAAELDELQSDLRTVQRLEREWLLFFPQGRYREKSIMPTRLGNILRAAEIYSLERYEADAVILWPRLVPFLPAEFAESLNAAQTAMEVMLVLSALSFTFSAISCTLLAVFTLDAGLFTACATGFLLAWVCYRNSIYGALGYAELIKTAFDLYRGKLLEEIGLKQPEEERKAWDSLSQKIYRNIPFPPAPRPEPQPRTWLGKAVGDLIDLAQTASSRPQPPSAPGLGATAPVVAFSQQHIPAPPRLSEPHDRFPLFYFGALLLLSSVGILVLLCQARQPVRRVALVRNVPAYHLLSAGDLKMATPKRSKAPAGGIRNIRDIAGKAYSSQPLAIGTLLRRSDIRRVEDPRLLDGKVAMGISATAPTLLGGALKPGDVVALAIAPAKDAPDPDSQCRLESLGRLLALDVKPPGKEGAPYVVVLAVPATCQRTLAGAASRISLARVL